MIPGREEAAAKRAIISVLPVLSNTTKLRAKPMATPPMALITVPRVMMVKFLVQRVFFIFLTLRGIHYTARSKHE